MEDNIETEVVQTKNKKIGINVIFNFISQLLTLVIPLITAPYLARVLHEEGNGRIAYSLSIVTTLLPTTPIIFLLITSSPTMMLTNFV